MTARGNDGGLKGEAVHDVGPFCAKAEDMRREEIENKQNEWIAMLTSQMEEREEGQEGVGFHDEQR